MYYQLHERFNFGIITNFLLHFLAPFPILKGFSADSIKNVTKQSCLKMLQITELVTRHVLTVFDVNKFRMHTSGFKFRKCLNHHDHLVDPQNIIGKGPSINYVVLVGVGGSPKDDLLHRPYLIKKGDKGRGLNA